MWRVDLFGELLYGLWAECRVLAVRECAWKLAEIVVGTNFRRFFFWLFSSFSFGFFFFG